MIEISEINEIITKSDWDNFLNEIEVYDFYHTYDYHQIAKSENDKAVLLTYKENDIIIGFPIIIRPIPNTSYFDATSVYGYCGPICKNVTDEFNNENLIKSLKEYFNTKNIISVFSRLNPFVLQQKNVLKGYGEIVSHGKLVNIDITQDVDIQRHEYQSRLKTHINKSRRNCIIKKAETKEDVLKFVDIYYENMTRVEAKSYYYFTPDYFFDLLRSKSFTAEILLALEKETSEIIAGSMFIKTNGIIQYHLSGTKNDYLHLMPNKLLIDEMRIQGTAENYDFFNLGGGLGGHENDSLFRFKSSFSKNFKDFRLWKLISNQEIYNELVDEKEVERQNETSFFPLYRYSEND